MGLNYESGVIETPPKIVVHAKPKVGKSTFASGIPNAIAVQPDKGGLDKIGMPRMPKVDDYDQIVAQIGEILTVDHDFNYLVVDTADMTEDMLHKHIAFQYGKENIDKIEFGKGYKYAFAEWKNLLYGLDCVRQERGMGIVLLCQSKVKQFTDPEGEQYDQYTLKLHDLVTEYVKEWADAILFGTVRMRMEEKGKGFSKRTVAKAIGLNGGERIFRCVGSPACIAGNRYGMPDTLPMSWEAIEPYLNFSAKEN